MLSEGVAWRSWAEPRGREVGGGRGLWRKNQWQLSELELGGVNWLRGVARRMWAWPGDWGGAKGRG